MIRRRPTRGRRGLSLIDVAISATLLGVVMLIAVQVILSLSDASQASLIRANTRRQVLTIETNLTNDLGSAAACAPGGLGPVFDSLNGSLGADSLSLYSDADGDGDVDLVGYRLSDSRLERAVSLNTTGCSQLSLSNATWESLATPATLTDGQPVFEGLSDGVATGFSGSCSLNLTSCRFQGVRARLTLQPPGLAAVQLDDVFALPQAISAR